MKVLDNDDVEVTFRACRDREIYWYLFAWGNKYQIIEPKNLKNTYKDLPDDALKNNKIMYVVFWHNYNI